MLHCLTTWLPQHMDTCIHEGKLFWRASHTPGLHSTSWGPISGRGSAEHWAHPLALPLSLRCSPAAPQLQRAASNCRAARGALTRGTPLPLCTPLCLDGNSNSFLISFPLPVILCSVLVLQMVRGIYIKWYYCSTDNRSDRRVDLLSAGKYVAMFLPRNNCCQC